MNYENDFSPFFNYLNKVLMLKLGSSTGKVNCWDGFGLALTSEDLLE
jgi:hypothetical protein